MQITPIEIRQKKFDKSFRGYQCDDVDEFLYALSQLWENLTLDFNALKTTLEESQKEVDRLQKVENALLATFKDAEVTASHITEQAKQKAVLKIQAAEIEAEKLLQDAKNKSKKLEEENQRDYQRLKDQMDQEREKAHKTFQTLEAYREEIAQKLQHLAEDILLKSQLVSHTHQHTTLKHNSQSKAAIAQEQEVTPTAPQ